MKFAKFFGVEVADGKFLGLFLELIGVCAVISAEKKQNYVDLLVGKGGECVHCSWKRC